MEPFPTSPRSVGPPTAARRPCPRLPRGRVGRRADPPVERGGVRPVRDPPDGVHRHRDGRPVVLAARRVPRHADPGGAVRPRQSLPRRRSPGGGPGCRRRRHGRRSCRRAPGHALEEVRAASPEGAWAFQVSALGPTAVAARTARRAADAGYRALCITVDTPRPGWRERSLEDTRRHRSAVALASANYGPEDYAERMAGAVGWTWDMVADLGDDRRLPWMAKGVLTDVRRACRGHARCGGGDRVEPRWPPARRRARGDRRAGRGGGRSRSPKYR